MAFTLDSTLTTSTEGKLATILATRQAALLDLVKTCASCLTIHKTSRKQNGQMRIVNFMHASVDHHAFVKLILGSRVFNLSMNFNHNSPSHLHNSHCLILSLSFLLSLSLHFCSSFCRSWKDLKLVGAAESHSYVMTVCFHGDPNQNELGRGCICGCICIYTCVIVMVSIAEFLLQVNLSCIV